MSKQNAKDAAVIGTQRYQQENVYRYTAVDGRCYDTERLPRPEDLKPHLTQQDYAVGRHQEKMNAAALAHIEELLTRFDGYMKEGRPLVSPKIKSKISPQRRLEIVEKYQLTLDKKANLYTGDADAVFQTLMAEHPSCAAFRNLKELLYAVLYGYAPTAIIKGSERDELA